MTTSPIPPARAPVLVMLALASVVFLSGCGAGSEESSRQPSATRQPQTSATEEAPAEASTFTKVEKDDLADVSVVEMTNDVGWEAVTEAARRPSEARYGERFAILAAQYLADSRRHELSTSQVDQLLDGPESLHNYLVGDHAAQVNLKTKRYIDPEISGWIRSDVQEEGSVVHTQLNAYCRGSVGGESAGGWVQYRVDVRHDGDRWRLTGFNNASALGAYDVKLTEHQKELFFYSGEGWRRIPAAT